MSRPGSKDEAAPGSLLLVVHDFIARSDDELSLAKGDRLELIERDDDFGDGWFLGRHMTNAKTGLFPEGMWKVKMQMIAQGTNVRQSTPHPLPKVPSPMPSNNAEQAKDLRRRVTVRHRPLRPPFDIHPPLQYRLDQRVHPQPNKTSPSL